MRGVLVGLALALVLVFSFREIDTIVLLASDTVMRRIYSMVHFSRDQEVAALAVILLLARETGEVAAHMSLAVMAHRMRGVVVARGDLFRATLEGINARCAWAQVFSSPYGTGSSVMIPETCPEVCDETRMQTFERV